MLWLMLGTEEEEWRGVFPDFAALNFSARSCDLVACVDASVYASVF